MAALILICRLLTPPAVLSTDSRAQSQSNMRGEPVSRILSRSTPLPAQSWAIIHLGGLLPGPSSCQPEPAGLKRPICGSYLALLPVGLAVPRLLPAARWATTNAQQYKDIECYGQCYEWDQGGVDYVIDIAVDQSVRDTLATVFHECVHLWQWERGTWKGEGEREATQLQYELADEYWRCGNV